MPTDLSTTATTRPPPAAEAVPTPDRGARVVALDVLRGFALCGILLVNIAPLTSFGYDVPRPSPNLSDPSGWLQLLVQQRFFPIFSVLFGMGFSLLLASAARRTARPRRLLLRRLLVLLPLGVLHQLVHPGEALAVYSVVGLVVLLPSSWLPRWAVAAAAVVLLPVTVLLVGGGSVLTPSLFLLGSALVRYGVVPQLDTSPRAPVVLLVLLAAFTAASVPAVAWQLADLTGSGFTTASAVAGLTLAGVYVTGVLLLLRTPLRRGLGVLFVPLGRTALTCYVAATPVMLLAGHLLDWRNSDSWTQLLLVGAAVLALQWVFAVLWLRRYHQGPLEWLWRAATWAQLPPLQRTSAERQRVSDGSTGVHPAA